MGLSAHVTSLQALEAFKAALARFASAAQNALAGVEVELQRAADWLEQHTAAWRAELMRREEQLTRAKSELAVRRFTAGKGQARNCTDQELAVARAQAALQHAQQKRDTCRRWVNLLPRHLEECHNPATQLSSMLDTELRQAMAFLEQKLTALEGYLAVTTQPAASQGTSPPLS